MTDTNKHWLLEDATQDRQSITREWLPFGQKTLEGVVLHEMRPVLTGYGHLTEMFRSEWRPDNSTVAQIFTSCLSGGTISAWHAHAQTTDRLFVASGRARIVLYDGREGSPTFGTINEFRIGALRPALLVVPPRVWHGVQNLDKSEPLLIINAVDRAYSYEGPDHWRVAPDSHSVPFTFER